ncbi:MAG: DUF2092 domain-containing protein [Planctomycetes bacterium]|nr:DUF2092 domain-containing protein [Planctomycetota bacterium]
MKLRAQSVLLGVAIVGGAGFAVATTAPAPAPAPQDTEEVVVVEEVFLDPDIYRIDPDAELVLKVMGDYLASMNEFSFRADVAFDEVRASGHRLQYGAVTKLSLRRPGQVRSDYTGDQRVSTAIINNGTMTFLNRGKNTYSKIEVPTDIDSALDHIFDEYNITVPIADFLYSNPYESLITHADAGDYVGIHGVDGEPCHHLVFHQEEIDWQIWVATGPRPVPRKVVITYRAQDGVPQYSARLSEWNFNPQHSDHFFMFRAPEGADQIEPLPREKEEDE